MWTSWFEVWGSLVLKIKTSEENKCETFVVEQVYQELTSETSKV